jgi:hypothetical protein
MTFSVDTNNLAPDTAEESVSDTSLAFSPAAAVAVNKLAVLPVVWDNVNGTNTDDTTILSAADTKGNTWTRAAECQYSAGAALDGILVGILYSVVTTQIETTDTITITSTANGTAKGATLVTFNRDSSKTVAVAGKGYQRIAASADYSASVSGLASEEHLWIGINGMEASPANTNAGDVTYTVITQGIQSFFGAGTGVSAAGARAGYKIATDTGETYDRTALTVADRATALVAFREVAGGGPTVTRRTLLGVGV